MPRDGTVTLRPITAVNWRECAELDVREHQRSWLPSNLVSIAAAQFYPDNYCRAVYAGEELVGFGMYGIEQNTNRIKVFRLMIGGTFQQRGYGVAAMAVILKEIAQRWPSSAIYVSYQEENVVARRLYDRLRFSQIEQCAGKITACRPGGQTA
jgi:ribosomal protein S18 acetylase RimI-like enzyme